MPTEEQLKANRENAQKSTGPRTPEGKLRSSRNAVKYSLNPERVVVPTENGAEFEVRRRSLLRQLAPVGPMEIVLVEQIIMSAWRLQRCRLIETRLFHQCVDENGYKLERYDHPVPSDVLTFAYRNDRRDVTEITRHEGHIERALYRAIRELERCQTNRKTNRNEPNFSPAL